jgi:hypothetical protein
MTSSTLFTAICDGARRESVLWERQLRGEDERSSEAVFSTLVPDPSLALGLETIYEGYLLHYGRSRLFEPSDTDIALLLGDALLAHGLVHVAELGNVPAVADLADLLSLCAQTRAEGRPGDGEAWAATAALLGLGGLEAARTALRDDSDPRPLAAAARARAGVEPVEAALARHARWTLPLVVDGPVR